MDSEFNLAFLKVKDILYDLAGQNDLLFLDLEYDEWNSMLKKRSKKIMLSSNKKLVIKNKFHNDTLHRPDINQ